MAQESQPLMKDGIDLAAIERIAQALDKTFAEAPELSFDRQIFIARANQGLSQLELKARVHHIISALAECLPSEFTTAAPLLNRLKAHWPESDRDDSLGVFAAWPVIDYVGVHGTEHPEIALDCLRQLTGLFSAEFAIRPFLIHFPELTHQCLLEWVTDDDPKVRRLVSEGCRPRLPWGQRLPAYVKDPSPVVTLLERLKDDDCESVRRSVANNLNDISKDHPDRVIEICQRWMQESTGTGDEFTRGWVVRHGTRSLVKAGHPGVFELLGYTASPKVSIDRLEVAEPLIHLGGQQPFTLVLRSTSAETQRLVVDYAVHHVKGNQQQKPKVFKLKKLTLAPGGSVTLQKNHSFKKITTRRYYPGTHTIEVLVNGVSYQRVDFELEC